MVASMSHFDFQSRNGNIDLSGEDLINKDQKEKEKEKDKEKEKEKEKRKGEAERGGEEWLESNVCPISC